MAKTEVVYSGVVVSSGYIYTLEAGDIGSDTTVNSGGYFVLSESSTAIGTTVEAGGHMYISGGGLASGTLLEGGSGAYALQYILSGGEAHGTTTSGGGMQIMLSGAYASGTGLNYGGQQTVYAGATAEGTTVGYAGVQMLFMTAESGTDSNTYIGALGTVIDSGGTQLFYAASAGDYMNLTALGTVVNSGGAQFLGYYDYGQGGWTYTGGISLSGFVIGGEQYVPYRGAALDTVVLSGGTQYLFYGGYASATTVLSGFQLVYNGAAALDTLMTTASGVLVADGEYGAAQEIYSGGYALYTQLGSGTVQYVMDGGYASTTIIYEGGTAMVASGGTLRSAVVGKGELVVSSGAILEGNIFTCGSTLEIEKGANVESATLVADVGSAAGLGMSHDAYDEYGAPALNWQETLSGFKFGVNVTGDTPTGIYSVCDHVLGEELSICLNGATAGTLTLNTAAGTENCVYVLLDNSGAYRSGYVSVGAATAITYNEGALQLLVSRITNYANLVIDDASKVYNELYCGCTATDTLVNGAGKAFYVNRGAVSSGTAVVSGYEIVNGGAAVGSWIASGGGMQLINSGSVAYGTLLAGEMSVQSGNAASGAIVTGGTLTLEAGAVIGGVTGIAGGTLEVRGSAVNSGVILASLRGDYANNAYVTGFSDLSGGAFAVNGDDSDSGNYILLTGAGSAPTTVNVIYNEANTAVTVGEETTIGALTYKFSTIGNTLSVSAYGKYTTLSGRVEGSANSVLTASNCRVKSLITGAAQEVYGDVVMKLALTGESPCNVYGGGNGVGVEGSVFMTLTSGSYTGMIYGGSRGSATGATVGDTVISVSGIVQSDNPKLLKSGNSAWLLGGGAAVSGGTAVSGNVDITVSGATLGQLVGGGQAQDENSIATVDNVNISIRNASISGDVFGGGYAYNSATSEVLGNVQITLYADEENFLYSYGTIFGGGANPGHGASGGWSLVRGNSTITLTGDGDFYNLVELNGDGKVGGTVYGTKTLEFKDFTNEFAANAKNFDAIKFSGATSLEANGSLRAETLVFDLTGRTEDDDAFARGAGFAPNREKTFDIELGDASGSIALLRVENESDLANAAVNLYRDGELLGSFSYGGGYSGFTLACVGGVLRLES